MRKYLVVIIAIFCILFIPNNVFAATKVQFNDLTSYYSVDEINNITSRIENDTNFILEEGSYKTHMIALSQGFSFWNNTEADLMKDTSYYTVIFYNHNANTPYFINWDTINFNSTGKCIFYDNNFNYLGSIEGNFRFVLNGGDYILNFPILKTSDNFIKPYTLGVDFYVADRLLFSTVGSNSFYDNYIREYNEVEKPPSVPTFEIDSIHNISVKIVGDDVPNEYSFVYLVVDFLLLLSFVVVILSPFVIIIRLMRWY